jgi:UDP-arabinose 4-epimerase
VKGNVLVTGGAGYIGSHTCKALAAAGYTPVTLDNLKYGHRSAIRWGPLEEGDVRDRSLLDRIFEAHRPIAVMHFAAYANVGESVENPGKYYRNNVEGTLTLLEAMRDHQVTDLVFSSTCATYGIPERLPISETCEQRPINPYGASKLMAETMIRDFSAAHNLSWIALRYFNAAGADPDGEIGEVHNPETHLIPLIFGAVTGQRSALTIFGNDYETKDGTCIRDYIHVTDLAEAHLRAMELLANGGSSRAYNLGTGHGHSVMEVIEAVTGVTGRQVPFTIGARRSGDPAVLVSDPSLALCELNWSAGITALEDVVGTAWAWHQRHTGAGEA